MINIPIKNLGVKKHSSRKLDLKKQTIPLKMLVHRKQSYTIIFATLKIRVPKRAPALFL